MHNRSRLKYIYILFALVLFVVYLVLAASFFKQDRTPQTKQERATITPLPTFVPGQGKMLQVLENRPTLSPVEQQIKVRLLTPLNNQTGLVHKDSSFMVYYLAETDSFQVRMSDIDLERGKQQAIEWFASLGFSKQGLCGLVIDFHLSPQQSQSLTKPFSPFPQGCYK